LKDEFVKPEGKEGIKVNVMDSKANYDLAIEAAKAQLKARGKGFLVVKETQVVGGEYALYEIEGGEIVRKESISGEKLKNLLVDKAKAGESGSVVTHETEGFDQKTVNEIDRITSGLKDLKLKEEIIKKYGEEFGKVEYEIILDEFSTLTTLEQAPGRMRYDGDTIRLSSTDKSLKGLEQSEILEKIVETSLRNELTELQKSNLNHDIAALSQVVRGRFDKLIDLELARTDIQDYQILENINKIQNELIRFDEFTQKGKASLRTNLEKKTITEIEEAIHSYSDYIKELVKEGKREAWISAKQGKQSRC